jgi:hypothetical protein
MAHFVWPVMKLPGRMLIPCKIQTHPRSKHKTPETFNAMRISRYLLGGGGRCGHGGSIISASDAVRHAAWAHIPVACYKLGATLATSASASSKRGVRTCRCAASKCTRAYCTFASGVARFTSPDIRR